MWVSGMCMEREGGGALGCVVEGMCVCGNWDVCGGEDSCVYT